MTRTQKLTQAFQGLMRMVSGQKGPADAHASLTTEALGLILVKGVYMGLAFVLSLYLARVLSVDGFGAYSYALAIIEVLVILAIFGLDREVIRTGSAYQAQNKWGSVRGILLRAQQVAVINAVALALLAAAAVLVAGESLAPDTRAASLTACLLLPVWALLRVREAAIQSFRKVLLSQLPSSLLQPILMILFVLCLVLLPARYCNASYAVGANIASQLVCLVVAGYLLRSILPAKVKQHPAEFRTSLWVKSAFPLLLLDGIAIFNGRIGLILVGTILGELSAGVFSATLKVASLISLVSLCVNIALAPLIATCFYSKRLEDLRAAVQRSSRLTFLVSLPIALGLAGIGSYVLGIFGKEFTVGTFALTILVIEQLIIGATGPAAIVLAMTNHNRETVFGLAFGLVLNIVLCLAFIPNWGIEGAAYAALISTLFSRILLTIIGFRKLGVRSDAFARRRVTETQGE